MTPMGVFQGFLDHWFSSSLIFFNWDLKFSLLGSQTNTNTISIEITNFGAGIGKRD